MFLVDTNIWLEGFLNWGKTDVFGVFVQDTLVDMAQYNMDFGQTPPGREAPAEIVGGK